MNIIFNLSIHHWHWYIYTAIQQTSLRLWIFNKKRQHVFAQLNYVYTLSLWIVGFLVINKLIQYDSLLYDWKMNIHLLIIDVPTHNSSNIIQLWRWFVRKLPTVFWLIVITTTCKLFRIWILDCKILSIFPLERYFKNLSRYCAFHLQLSLAIIVRFSKNIKTANKFGSRDIFGFYLIFYDFAEKINK